MTPARRIRPAILVALLCAATLFGSATACGRKTKVLPPDLVVPRVVEGLTATNELGGIALEWERPTEYADGSDMLDLAGFRVERRRPCCGFQVIAQVAVEDRYRFRRAKQFRHLDEAVSTGEIYLYRVIAYTLDGYESAPHEPVQIQREPPLAEGAATPGP